VYLYCRISSTNFAASDKGNLSDPRLKSQVGTVHMQVCFCIQSGGGTSIHLLMQQLQSCDCCSRAITFVRFAMKLVMQNDRDFVDVTLLYIYNQIWLNCLLGVCISVELILVQLVLRPYCSPLALILLNVSTQYNSMFTNYLVALLQVWNPVVEIMIVLNMIVILDSVQC